jgi:DNA-directed RNA polymerase subunit RPC12/RpoP
VKTVPTFIVTFVVLCSPAVAYGVTAFDGEAAETLTLAQVSEDVYCPNCSTKNEAGAIYCVNCGKKLPALRTVNNFCPKCGENIERGAIYCPYCRFRLTETAETRPEEGRWKRSLLTLSTGVEGWFGGRTCVAPTADLVFNICDYFVLGPAFSFFFHGDGWGFLVGLESRPYAIPYSRSYFLKPHANVGAGYAYENYEISRWSSVKIERWYVRPGGGLDVRIAESRFVPYLDWNVLIFFGGGEVQRIEKIKTAFVFEGGIRITL